MPLFSYVCKSCQAEHEILVRGETVPECPSCGSQDLVKQASAFATLAGGPPRRSEAPAGCGASSCCQMAGGGCPFN